MRRRIRKGVQALELDAKVTYQVGLIEVGVMSLINRKQRGREDTEVNFLFDHLDVQEALEQIHCYPGSEFTSLDIMKIVRGLNKRGRMRFRLQLPYPPPSVAKAWQRAHDRIDMWLKLDLAPESKKVQLPAVEVPDSPTVQEAWDEYWDEMKHKLTPGTAKSYPGYWNNHMKPLFGNKRVRDVLPEDLEKWLRTLEEKELAQNYIVRLYQVFRAVFKKQVLADKRGKRFGKPAYRTFDCENPFDHIETPKEEVKKERGTFEVEDLRAYIEACKKDDPTLTPIVAVAAMSGCRISEVIGLKWSSIIWSKGQRPGAIRVQGVVREKVGYVEEGKTSNALRTMPMHRHLEQILRLHFEQSPTVPELTAQLASVTPAQRRRGDFPKHLKLMPRPIVKGQGPDGFVFVHGLKDRHLFYNDLWRRLTILIQRYDLKKIENRLWHEFRHAFISWAMAKGVDVKALQLAVGHGDMQTTMGYTHLVDRDDRWIHDVYSLWDDDPAQRILDVETSESGRNGVQVGCNPKLGEGHDPLLESIIAFRAQNKEWGWQPSDAHEKPSDTLVLIAFLWSIHGIYEQPILHPVSRGES